MMKLIQGMSVVRMHDYWHVILVELIDKLQW